MRGEYITKAREHPQMRLFLLAIIAASVVLPALAYAQEPDYNVIKSQRSESFVFPYTA